MFSAPDRTSSLPSDSCDYEPFGAIDRKVFIRRVMGRLSYRQTDDMGAPVRPAIVRDEDARVGIPDEEESL